MGSRWSLFCDWEGLLQVYLLNTRILFVIWLQYWSNHLLRSCHLLQRLSHVLTHWHIWFHLLAHWHVLLGSDLSAIVFALVVVWLLTTVEVFRALLSLALTETTLGALVLWAGSTYLLVHEMGWDLLKNVGNFGKEIFLVDYVPRSLIVIISLEPLFSFVIYKLLHFQLLSINFFCVHFFDSCNGSLGSNFEVIHVLRKVSDYG